MAFRASLRRAVCTWRWPRYQTHLFGRIPEVVPPSTSGLRLFVGLWLGEDTRRALVSHQLEWSWPPGARLMEPESLHVTLHFIGAFPSERLPELDLGLATANAPRFNLEFGEPDVWPGGIAVLHVRPNAALTELHRLVGIQLRQLGIELDARPYAPHVTLARRASGATTPSQVVGAIEQVDSMVLAESVSSPTPHYDHLRTYGLT